MRWNRNMQAHCLAGALTTSFLQYLIHRDVRAGDYNLAWRIDISNEDRVLDRGHSLDDFRDLSFIQSHDRGETVARGFHRACVAASSIRAATSFGLEAYTE